MHDDELRAILRESSRRAELGLTPRAHTPAPLSLTAEVDDQSDAFGIIDALAVKVEKRSGKPAHARLCRRPVQDGEADDRYIAEVEINQPGTRPPDAPVYYLQQGFGPTPLEAVRQLSLMVDDFPPTRA